MKYKVMLEVSVLGDGKVYYIKNVIVDEFDNSEDALHFIHAAQDFYESKLFLEVEE